ncbi:MAG: OmpW family outer membrane protein [Candidatus Aminicenantes bacterium]
MQKKRLSVVLLLFLVFAFSKTALAGDVQIRVITENANIRLTPDFNSTIIIQAPFGAVFNVTQQIKNWYSITLRDEESGDLILGYIHKSFVEEIRTEHLETQKTEPPPQKKLLRRVRPPRKPKALRHTPDIGKSGFGIRGGYTLFENDNYKENGSYGLSLSLGFVKFLSLEINGVYSEIPTVGSAEELQKGKLSLIPVQVGLFLRLPIANRFVPYMGGGIGYYYVYKFTVDSGVSETWNSLGFEIRENIESELGYHAALGMDVFMADNIALNIDARYCQVELDGTWSIRDTITDLEQSGEMKGLNFSRLTIGGGLKILF